MLETICSRKLPNIFQCELQSVVGHDLISKAGKQGAHRANGLLSSSILHHENLGPLAVCISYYHEHISPDWPSKIDMKPLSGESGILPPMDGLHELDYLLSLPDITDNF